MRHRAIDAGEDGGFAQFNLGLLYAELNRMEDAEKALQASLDIEPNNARAAFNLAVMKAGKNYPECFRLLNIAIEADPYNTRYIETLAYYYMQTRQADLAKKILEQATERGANSRDIQSMIRQLMAQ